MESLLESVKNLTKSSVNKRNCPTTAKENIVRFILESAELGSYSCAFGYSSFSNTKKSIDLALGSLRDEGFKVKNHGPDCIEVSWKDEMKVGKKKGKKTDAVNEADDKQSRAEKVACWYVSEINGYANNVWDILSEPERLRYTEFAEQLINIVENS